MRLPTVPLLALVSTVSLVLVSVEISQAEDDTPPGVERLLPRGEIPAIFEPSFVPGSDAGIPDDAWILGVAIGKTAKAYSLNLLNHHEVVNDESEGVAYAAVW